ncbi:MAG: glucose-1-phosphate thymidylyltransferase RfbA [Flavobacteriaceae bacterium]
MKGVVLAGGKGSRLYPITMGVSKQLLPIYDCPMIYYPLSVLLRAGISEILLISSPDQLPAFQNLLGKGSDLGVSISYASQDAPRGIAEALIIAEDFLKSDACILILGDNLFYGDGVEKGLQKAINNSGASIFSYPVKDPERYGVIEFDTAGTPKDIIEKPTNAPSNRAVTGLYVYPNSAVDVAKGLKPSGRGEIEITDVNKHYLKTSNLRVIGLSKSDSWFDTGTIDSLYEATDYVRALESRVGVKIGCIEEAALQSGLISSTNLKVRADLLSGTSYGDYLNQLIITYGD